MASPNSSAHFETSRIDNYPDKKTLEDIKAYFKTFAEHDFQGMYEMQAEDYTMTDIPLRVVRVPRAIWLEINRAFVSSIIVPDTKVTAISLDGSSAAGSFSVLENLVEFRLAADPPPGAAPNLPPGAKKGDLVGMIMMSVIWWDGKGGVLNEVEYGRLTWEGFSLAEFDHGKVGGGKGRGVDPFGWVPTGRTSRL